MPGVGQRYCAALMLVLLSLPAFTARTVPILTPQIKALEPSGTQEIPDWLARWELARVLSYMQRYDEALIEYQRLLAARPDLNEAKLEMARILAWTGQSKQAVAYLEQLPASALGEDGLLILAEVHIADKQWDAAVQLLRNYLAGANVGSRKIRFKLAQVLSWQKNYAAALEQYEILLQEFDDDVQLKRHYGLVLIWAERYEQAVEVLRATLPVKDVNVDY